LVKRFGNIERKKFRKWLDKVRLTYHSPHKFRHGHIQFGAAHSKTVADFKAVSMNVMHASMEITDQFYSNLNDGEVQKRISSLGIEEKKINPDNEMMALLNDFFEWKKNKERVK
jgi:hypothetical protein